MTDSSTNHLDAGHRRGASVFRIHRFMSAAAVAAVFSVSACADRDTAPSLAGPAAPANGVTAYLGVSNDAPAAGQEIVVSVHALRAAGSLPVGSFMMKLAYDTTALEFNGLVTDSSSMVMANRVGTNVILAGANGSGFGSTRLAQLRMTVKNPAALASLSLNVTELTATDFSAQTRSTIVDRRVYRGIAR